MAQWTPHPTRANIFINLVGVKVALYDWAGRIDTYMDT